MLFLLQTLIILVLTLIAFRMGKAYLIGWVAASIVLANIFVTKQLKLFGLDATGGNIMYASIFLATDLLSEHYTKEDAKIAVKIGFLSSVLYLVSSQFVLRFLPSEYDTVQGGMQEIFAFAPRILIGSMVAYLVSQFHDIWAYNAIHSKTGQKLLWLRNNGSTWVSQLLDSVIFSLIAFLGVFPFNVVLGIILSTYLLKVIVAALDTPFMYLSYRVKGSST
jgi:uncharacterized integral membrane protein (TIGR00697 family)